MISSVSSKIDTLRYDDNTRGETHGFGEDEASLHDAFTLNPLRFNQQLPDSSFQQVVIQNNKIWIYT